MKSDLRIIAEALKGSLSAQVKVVSVDNFHLTVEVKNTTDAGTPVKKQYRIALEPYEVGYRAA